MVNPRSKRRSFDGVTSTPDEPTAHAMIPNHASRLAAGTPMATGDNSTVAQTDCQLVVQEGPDRGQALALTPGKTYAIGRGVNNDLVLSDLAVSRRQFEVRFSGGGWWLRDLGSGNGTLINDVVHAGEVQVYHGDLVEVGTSIFALELPGFFRREIGAAPRGERPKRPLAVATPAQVAAQPPPINRHIMKTQPPAGRIAHAPLAPLPVAPLPVAPLPVAPLPRPLATGGVGHTVGPTQEAPPTFDARPLSQASPSMFEPLTRPAPTKKPVARTTFSLPTFRKSWHPVAGGLGIVLLSAIATVSLLRRGAGSSPNPPASTGLRETSLAHDTRTLAGAGATTLAPALPTEPPAPPPSVAVQPTVVAVTPTIVDNAPFPLPAEASPQALVTEPQPPALPQSPPRPESKPTSNEPREQLGAIKQRADELYRGKRFRDAANAVRASRELRALASAYEGLARTYQLGTDGKTKPAEALQALEGALNYDARLGGAHATDLEKRITQVAPKAAGAKMGAKDYVGAFAAVRTAERHGAGENPTVRGVKKSLEAKAAQLFAEAKAVAKGDPDGAVANYKTILRIVDNDSTWHQKAQRALDAQ